MTILELNKLEPAALREALGLCCGAAAWVEGMLGLFPVATEEALLQGAERIWYACGEGDWREAFTHHPRIGDLASLKVKFGSTGQWAAGEQSGVNAASEEVLSALAAGNEAYEQRFGYIFIVCATGKSAVEMLALLKARLGNTPETEIRIAMGEQNKITRIRLEKLLA
ncbi:MAG TPA: 2-oxo-4-hydroxy-4-carboxy-5-ureidoimidazoline decarboxylase [Puia sp.]|nr:2-oxo-4-hydroxy-4-carboxy-5-ureidoimidazoline decarboxylase [Puia sp.]